MNDPHVQDSGTLSWLPDPVLGALPFVNLSGTAPLESGDSRSTAPAQGPHTDEVLAEHDFGQDAIAAMKANGAVA